jgi:hypothetical protein
MSMSATKSDLSGSTVSQFLEVDAIEIKNVLPTPQGELLVYGILHSHTHLTECYLESPDSGRQKHADFMATKWPHWGARFTSLLRCKNLVLTAVAGNSAGRRALDRYVSPKLLALPTTQNDDQTAMFHPKNLQITITSVAAHIICNEFGACLANH